MPIFPKSLLFLSFLLLSSTPSQSFSCKYGALFSLSHSLISRVPALRSARGDVEGAARARALADNLDNLRRVYGLTVLLDYMKNYDRKDATSFRDLGGVVSDLNELLGVLRGLNQARLDVERAAWAGRNYKNALGASQSLFDRLLKGPLQDIVLSLQKEVADGDLLRDIIELVAGDLKSCTSFQLFSLIHRLQYNGTIYKCSFNHTVKFDAASHAVCNDIVPLIARRREIKTAQEGMRSTNTISHFNLDIARQL